MFPSPVLISPSILGETEHWSEEQGLRVISLNEVEFDKELKKNEHKKVNLIKKFI